MQAGFEPVSAPCAGGVRRILAVVELGSHWGHLLRLLPVIDRLQSEGHRVLLAVADIAKAHSVLRRPDLTLVKCPGALVDAQPRPIEYTFYAQILERCVFGDEALLARSIGQWDALLQAWQPDALLTDFAPGALFAAHLHKLRVVQIPVGWEAPPPGPTLPVIRPWKHVDPSAVQQHENRLVERLNVWCRARCVPAFRSLSDLYLPGRQLLTTFPELDSFGPRGPEACYVGPIFTQDLGKSVDWVASAPGGAVPCRVLAYLRPSASVVPLLLHLRQSTDADLVAVLQGQSPAVVAHLRAAGVRVVDTAVRLQRLLPEADLVVTNGGHGTAAAALLSGVPLLAVPLTVDQFILGERLEATGAAVSLPDAAVAGRMQEATRRLLHGGGARQAAQILARRYAGRSQYRTVSAIVQTLTT